MITSYKYIRSINYQAYIKLFGTPLAEKKNLRYGVYREKFSPQITDFALYKNK